MVINILLSLIPRFVTDTLLLDGKRCLAIFPYHEREGMGVILPFECMELVIMYKPTVKVQQGLTWLGAVIYYKNLKTYQLE